MCVTTTGHTSFIELVYIDTVCYDLTTLYICLTPELL